MRCPISASSEGTKRGGLFCRKKPAGPGGVVLRRGGAGYYIPGRKRVFFAAGSMEELTGAGSSWRGGLRESKKIRLYPSKEAAERSRPVADAAMLPYYEADPGELDLPLPFEC